MVMISKKSPDYDVIVIGGGPAGMMAAGRAAMCGASVLLLEKNSGLGKKLLISGGGRSNFTNAEFDTSVLLKKYGERSKFLHSPFAQFSVKDTFQFFESHGMPTKVEAEKRAFPKSDTARSVLDALVHFMKEGGVVVKTESEVKKVVTHNDTYVVTEKGGSYSARAIVVNTGNASLVPIRTREIWGHALSGLAFAEAKITLLIDGKVKDKKQGVRVGKILFTHTGLSGPAILNMSMNIGEALEQGVVTLTIDIFPKEDLGALDKRLRALFQQNLNKKTRNVLKEFIPASLVDVTLAQHALDGEREVNGITKEERTRLCAWLKAMIITPTRLMGKDKAVVTSGGIALTDIDTKTMESKKLKKLYVVGDVLDVDRPSGGYSLQLCWTTGWVAGTHAAEKKKGP